MNDARTEGKATAKRRRPTAIRVLSLNTFPKKNKIKKVYGNFVFSLLARVQTIASFDGKRRDFFLCERVDLSLTRIRVVEEFQLNDGVVDVDDDRFDDFFLPRSAVAHLNDLPNAAVVESDE